MDAVSTPTVLLIGGPDAGKSNFLFRFWLAVESDLCTLVKNGLPDELEYLQAGSERLLHGEFAGRTPGEVVEQASIPVKMTGEPTKGGMLVVPDVPGENILEVYRMRQWNEAWESRVGASCGCLLFVRAGSPETVATLDYETCRAVFGEPLAPPTLEETTRRPS